MLVAAALVSAGALILLRQRRSRTSVSVQTNNSNDMSNGSYEYWDLRKYTDKELSRGYRNNNPVNIDYNSANNWQGQTGIEPEGRFAQFMSIPYGYRAALALLRNYISNPKIMANTIRKIVERFAPRGGNDHNNTDEYMNFVSQKTGIGLDTVLSKYDKETLCKIVYAMALFENRVTDVSKALNLPNMDLIKEGWRLL